MVSVFFCVYITGGALPQHICDMRRLCEASSPSDFTWCCATIAGDVVCSTGSFNLGAEGIV